MMIVDIWYKGVFLGKCNIFRDTLHKARLYKIIISKESGDRIGYPKDRTSKVRIFDIYDYIGEGSIIYDEMVSSRCIGLVADKLVMYAIYTNENDKDIFTLISK